MSDDEQTPDAGDASERPDDVGTPAPQSQEIRHSQVSALVPGHVARGTFSTGAVVLQGSHEFIIDFLLRMQQPQQVAARIVLPPSVVAQFITALRENLAKYETRFGPPPQTAIPQSPPDQRSSAQDLYDQLKLPDNVISGDYANAVVIGHTATEFSFDFITTFFPRSAVAHRVYLAAPNVPRLLDSLSHSWQQFRQRRTQPPESPSPEPPAESGPGADN